MNRDQLLKEADEAKKQARVATQRGDLDKAERILAALIADVEGFLDEDPSFTREAPDLPPRTEAGKLVKTVVEHLADSYGMLGGIEWRRGNLQRAVENYRKGSIYEREQKFGIQNSYNLTNLLVLEIIMKPDALITKQDEIREVHEFVRRQADRRRDQWWFWADYALLSAFIGDETEMRNAYQKFQDCGPRQRDYRSVLRVLDACKEAVRSASRATARLLDEATEQLASGWDHSVALNGL